LQRLSCRTSRPVSLWPLPADQRGVAAAELALVASVVIVMLLGVFDLGLWVWQRMQLQAALIAGVHYAQEFPGNGANIQSVIVAALPPGLLGATIVPPVLTRDCGADNSSDPGDGACSSGLARTFVTLEISYPFAPLYFTAIPTTIDVRYVIRVQ
jgi:hypothetical protein